MNLLIKFLSGVMGTPVPITLTALLWEWSAAGQAGLDLQLAGGDKKKAWYCGGAAVGGLAAQQ